MLVLGEIPKGVELARRRDAGEAAALERWLREVEARIRCTRARHRQRRPASMGTHGRHQTRPGDGLLAATALTNGLTLVTRNDRGVAGLGATVLNPFGDAVNNLPLPADEAVQSRRAWRATNDDDEHYVYATVL